MHKLVFFFKDSASDLAFHSGRERHAMEDVSAQEGNVPYSVRVGEEGGVGIGWHWTWPTKQKLAL